MLLDIKQIANKGLLYSTKNYTQYFVIAYKREDSEKECVYIYIHTHTYVSESLRCTPETNTTL